MRKKEEEEVKERGSKKTSYYPVFVSWPFVYIDTSKMDGDSCIFTPKFICVEVRISRILVMVLK